MARRLGRTPLSLKQCYVVAIVALVVASFSVYFFSFDSKVHVLACTGNYYLTDKQIYNLAQVNLDSRMITTPNTLLEKRVASMPLIESVQVKKKNNRMVFSVKEKVVIGYYVEDNQNYVLTIDNESIPIDSQYLKTIIHFPLLNGFTVAQRKQICEQFKKYKKNLNRSVIEKIAEMVPYETSFDQNMIKITMQDGNAVYTSLSSLVMMSQYEAMLTQLQGKSVCLLLDVDNVAIEKIDCSDIETSAKEKKKEKSNKKEETQENSLNLEDYVQDEMNDLNSEETTIEDDSQFTTDQELEDDQWMLDESTGLQYNIYSGIYRDPYSGIQYIYNEETQMFDPIE